MLLRQGRRNVKIGRGLGGILSNIFSKIAPFAKTLFNIGKRAFNSTLGQSIVNKTKENTVESGMKALDDVMKGKNVVESLKSNIKDAATKSFKDSTNLVQKAVKRKLSPDDDIPKKTRNKKNKKKQKKYQSIARRGKGRTKQDIFSTLR